MQPPYPEGLEQAVFGLGCFWGAERKFWELGEGIYTTAVGYAGGHTPNPTYEEVCSGRTGHTEVVLVVFDPKKVAYEKLLKTFWESHNPTQGMRQGNDVGTQYRSAIYTFNDAQRKAADASKATYQKALRPRASAPSPPRSPPPVRSISPRTIISNIWPRTRRAIAASAAPACPARSASASARRERITSPASCGARARPSNNHLLTITGARLSCLALRDGSGAGCARVSIADHSPP